MLHFLPYGARFRCVLITLAIVLIVITWIIELIIIAWINLPVLSCQYVWLREGTAMFLHPYPTGFGSTLR